MARWVAIVALLLGMGLTAFESFGTSTGRESQVRIMDGNSPMPPDKLTGGDKSAQPPSGDPSNEATSISIGN